jgi:signal peptide peptidase SppA
MSDIAARAALSRMHLQAVALSPAYSGFAQDLRDMAMTDPVEAQVKFQARLGEMCESFGFSQREQSKPFAFADGVAIIPIQGTLINRFGQSYGFITGYNFIRRQLAQAMADDDVKAIVYDVNSNGGEAAGCFELAAEMSQAAAVKPSMSLIDSNAYSAGYALASAASKVVMTPSGGAGSVGVVAMHMDFSKLLTDIGIKITFIHFGDHKVDGNPYEALSADAKKSIQKNVDKTGGKFVALIASHRNIDAAKVRDTEARCYDADDALSLGLIDAIATPSQAMQVLFDELSGSTSTTARKDDEMSDTKAQPGATDQASKDAADAQAAANAKAIADASATASATAKTAERARVQGILNCEEAKGKSALANHLALNTDMSVDDAKAMLKVAAAEAPAAAAGAAFNQAMDNTANPNVGANGGGAGGDGQTPAQRILANQELATGRKLAAVK